MTPHHMTQASEAAAEVLERIAAHNLADPVTDDLTVPLAIELAETQEQNRQLLAQVEELKAALGAALDMIDRYQPGIGTTACACGECEAYKSARAALKGGR